MGPGYPAAITTNASRRSSIAFSSVSTASCPKSNQRVRRVLRRRRGREPPSLAHHYALDPRAHHPGVGDRIVPPVVKRPELSGDQRCRLVWSYAQTDAPSPLLFSMESLASTRALSPMYRALLQVHAPSASRSRTRAGPVAHAAAARADGSRAPVRLSVARDVQPPAARCRSPLRWWTPRPRARRPPTRESPC